MRTKSPVTLGLQALLAPLEILRAVRNKRAFGVPTSQGLQSPIMGSYVRVLLTPELSAAPKFLRDYRVVPRRSWAHRDTM